MKAARTGEPTQIGPYRVLEVLVRRGLYREYRVCAEDREFALRTLVYAALADPETMERHRREATVLSRVKHPNLVEIVDWGVWEQASVWLLEATASVCSLPVLRLARNGHGLLAALPGGAMAQLERRPGGWVATATRVQHRAPICGLEGNRSVAWDGMVITWGDDLSVLSEVDLEVPARSMSGDAVGLQNGVVQLLTDGRRLRLSEVAIHAVSFSSDRRRLAVANRRGAIDVWQLRS
ncbi:MAG: hypothetical protein ACYCW6_11815 [Candidatus Xenobia bacterium]